MTEQEQRIAIAESVGWTWKDDNDDCFCWHISTGAYVGKPIFSSSSGTKLTESDHLPNYLIDLNAMHEAENVLFESNTWNASEYEHRLSKITTSWCWYATAAQRAEAFLRTIGKWKE